jgi:hypothetical protein
MMAFHDIRLGGPLVIWSYCMLKLISNFHRKSISSKYNIFLIYIYIYIYICIYICICIYIVFNMPSIYAAKSDTICNQFAQIQTQAPCNFDNLNLLVFVCHCCLPLLAVPLTFFLIRKRMPACLNVLLDT